MQSRLLVDVLDGGKPAIRIKRPTQVNSDDAEDLRDKVLNMFFEGLSVESNFVGVIFEQERNTLLIPMTITHALEWMMNFFRENRAYTEDEKNRIGVIFGELFSIYHGEKHSTYNV